VYYTVRQFQHTKVTPDFAANAALNWRKGGNCDTLQLEATGCRASCSGFLLRGP